MNEIGISVETEDTTSCGSDLLRIPRGFSDYIDLCLSRLFESCDTILNLRCKLSGSFFGRIGESECNVNAMFLRDSWDSGSWGSGSGETCTSRTKPRSTMLQGSEGS